MSSDLVQVFHNRWAVPVLADLHRTRGGRFVALANRLGVSRESLRRTLAALERDGLVTRNPGYGHPLRPEWILTDRGAGIGAGAAALVDLLAAHRAEEVGMRKWSVPVVHALRGGPRRFSELRTALPSSSPRALALALKDLAGAGLVVRTVTDDFPPATVYRLTPGARAIADGAAALADGP